jgi:apolipoprotein N-acyltransferase
VTQRLPSHPLASPVIALITGALTELAFAPFGLWPAQIATLALLFWLALRETTIKRAAWIGWLYGFAWSTCGVYWLFVSMHRYGGMPSILAAIAVALMGAYLGIFPALAASIAVWLRRRWAASSSITLLLVFPAAWALMEWVCDWLFTGFPWTSAGYAHSIGPLAGFAPIVGVFGLALLAALIAGSLVLALEKKLALVIVALLLGAGYGLKKIDWTAPQGQPITVRLLQGNVSLDTKFNPEHIGASLLLYDEMIHAEPADLIATPETAVPVLSEQLPSDYLPNLAAFAAQTKSHLLIGIPVSLGPMQYANSVIGISPQTAQQQGKDYTYRYDKHHLVPFGEFVPFGFHWFVDLMHIPLGDFTRGPKIQKPFPVKDQWILPNICYEDLFGEEIAAQLAAARANNQPMASILLNVSNIAWFGDTTALPQHLQISQMRALETGRPMLRATNTGATAIIDPKGNIVKQMPHYTAGSLEATVQGYGGMTPYILLGNSLVVVLSLLMLIAAWLACRKGATSGNRI